MKKYEYKYFILIADESNSSLKNLEKLLKENWEPLRECAMPSSGSNYSDNAQFPTCLIVLRKEISTQT